MNDRKNNYTYENMLDRVMGILHAQNPNFTSVAGCKGILISMLNEGLEPNVVSYTTTIGACTK